MADETEAPPAPAKKGGGKLKLILIAVAVLAMGGGAAWWFMRGDASVEAHEAEEPGPETRGLLAFEPFLVNLADDGGGRFLKVNLQLMVESQAEATEIEETPVLVSLLRSTILELLTQQHAEELVTTDGKTKLKAELKEQVNRVLRGEKVVDVLFAEFVVQF